MEDDQLRRVRESLQEKEVREHEQRLVLRREVLTIADRDFRVNLVQTWIVC